jgi:DNA transformation protein
MTASAGFLEHLKDLLAPLGAISVRRMFGGAGIYCDGQMFALVDDDTLYLKTDEAGREAFEAEGMGPFTYTTKRGTGVLASYWSAPERLLEDPDDVLMWSRRALNAARRAALRTGPGGREKVSRRALEKRSAKKSTGPRRWRARTIRSRP